MPATDHHKKSIAERISNGVRHLGGMVSIPTFDVLDAYYPAPNREANHVPEQHTPDIHLHVQDAKKSNSFDNARHTMGAMLSIPICEAAESYGNGPCRSH